MANWEDYKRNARNSNPEIAKDFDEIENISLLCRLTENIQEASEDEAAEILEELDKLTDDDLEIVRTKSFTPNC